MDSRSMVLNIEYIKEYVTNRSLDDSSNFFCIIIQLEGVEVLHRGWGGDRV